MAHTPSFIIYTNIIEKLPIYRNLKLLSNKIAEKDFENKITVQQYINIKFKHLPQERNNLQGTEPKQERNLDVFILPDRSRYIRDNNVKKNWLSTLENDKNIDDIMIIYEQRSLKNTQLEKFQSINKFLEAWSYEKFIVVIPEHISVPEHRFATKEEIENATTNQYINKNNDLPLILAEDPPVVWIGGRPGDIIYIKRLSENTGYSEILRVVR